MTERVQGKIDLEAALGAALRARRPRRRRPRRSSGFLEGNSASVERPRSAAEWMQLRSQQWILGHLLEGTGRRLEMLQRVSSFREPQEAMADQTGRGVLFQRRRSSLGKPVRRARVSKAAWGRQDGGINADGGVMGTLNTAWNVLCPRCRPTRSG